jgi:hypothetical protein
MIALQEALTSHPQFNKTAPQSSPQLLFFVIDFLIRTMRDYLAKLDPDKVNSGDSAATEVYTDILSRNALLTSIIMDKTGKSKLFGKESEKDFEFGEEIEKKAKEMLDTGFGDDETDEGDEKAGKTDAPTNDVPMHEEKA